MKLHSLTAAGASSHDLVSTGMWNLLRQRFYAAALEAPIAANAEGWTDLGLDAVAEALEVLVGSWEVSRAEADDFRAWLAERSDLTLLVQVDSDGGWMATCSGPDEDAVQAALAAVSAAFPVPDLSSGSPAIAVRFWTLGPMGPISFQRRLEVTPWSEAAANYPGDVRAALAGLMAAGPPTSGGKLLVLHGPPGTGKTRVTESLAAEWAEWCDVDFVVDADNFFGVASYMVQTMVMGADDRWRLVVLEDAGEFLVADSHDRPKQGLSRLLNLADGMVGQGLKILVLVTTNEDASELHEAVTRPGRCMAEVPFVPFEIDEATAWLAARGIDEPATGPMTLARLYARA